MLARQDCMIGKIATDLVKRAKTRFSGERGVAGPILTMAEDSFLQFGTL